MVGGCLILTLTLKADTIVRANTVKMPDIFRRYSGPIFGFYTFQHCQDMDIRGPKEPSGNLYRFQNGFCPSPGKKPMRKKCFPLTHLFLAENHWLAEFLS